MGKKKDMTMKFHEFKEKQLKEQPTTKSQNLSNDIEFLQKLDGDDYTKIEGAMEIVKVLSVITDEEDIKKLEEASGGFQLSTDLSVKEVRRGDVIWLTALLKRPHSTTPFNQTTMGVIKARILDYYYGLNKLKYVNNHTEVKGVSEKNNDNPNETKI